MTDRALHLVSRTELAIADLRAELEHATPTIPPWMHAAMGELGVREIPGAANSDRVLEYLETCHRDRGGNLGDWATGRDETAWCSAFQCWCLLRAGIEPTRHAAARSWRSWGVECQPRVGCIVVLARDGGGHVGMEHELDDKPGVVLIGGNQGDQVSIKRYAESRVLTRRWPVAIEPS